MQRTLNPLVEGSNPSWPTSKIKELAILLAPFLLGRYNIGTLRQRKQVYLMATIVRAPSKAWKAVRGELLLKLLWGADESLGSESANGNYST